MKILLFGMEKDSGRWWRRRCESNDEAKSFPLHRLFCPLASGDEAVFFVEGVRPDGAVSAEDSEVPLTLWEPHPLRVPWGVPGWIDDALGWIAANAGEITSWKELKSWCLSCVIYAETPRGTVYFKATNLRPLFCNEPSVTQRLAEWFPGRVPAPIAIDAARGWMLLADFGPEIAQTDPENSAARILTDFSVLQQTTLGRESELLALGCVDRRPAQFAREVASLLADEESLSTLTEPEREKLLSVNWQEKIEAFSSVPCALVHGDLHTGNVATGAGRELLYFDWTDASVAMPWMDLLLPFWEKDEAASQSLLAAWSAPIPPWETIAPLIALHHAVSYRHIRDAIEPCVRHELDRSLPRFLRAAAMWQ